MNSRPIREEGGVHREFPARRTFRSDRSDRTDSEIVVTVLQGNLNAFGVLVDRHQKGIFNLSKKMVGNDEDARELTQDAFLRSFDKLETFNLESRFYTWLYAIARNVIISHLRRKASRPLPSLDQADADGDNPGTLKELLPDETGELPEERMIRLERQRMVENALGELDDDSRCIILLKDWEKMDYATIAEVLGINEGTVKSRLYRARQRFREILEVKMRAEN